MVECLKGPLWIIRGGGAGAFLHEVDGPILGPSISKYMRNVLGGSSLSDELLNTAVLDFRLALDFIFLATWVSSSSSSASSAAAFSRALFSHAFQFLISAFSRCVIAFFIINDVDAE